MQTYFRDKKRLRNHACWIAILLLSQLLHSQVLHGQGNERPGTRREMSEGNSTAGLSELAKDNFNRVAASAVQIRAVLAGDAGLLVELKRWIAKEATDSGQVVEDSKLTDEAVFERLDRDLVFRSAATRLLQRYGYLMPSPNPESSFGKEEELLLKERARRLVQIETQEDTESLQPKNNQNSQRDLEQAAACDPRQDENCDMPASRGRRTVGPNQNQGPTPDENPGAAPEEGSPSFSPNSSQTLLTDLMMGGGQEPALRDRMSPPIELASSSAKLGGDLPSRQFSSPFSSPFSVPSSVPSMPSGLTEMPDSTLNSDRSSVSEAPSQSRRPNSAKNRQLEEEEDLTPVKMVRRANPYADIPSLYDMYIQAASWQRPAQRFGLDMFRNTTNRPDVIPMDLPVGPDYVVGTETACRSTCGAASRRAWCGWSIGREELRCRRPVLCWSRARV